MGSSYSRPLRVILAHTETAPYSAYSRAQASSSFPERENKIAEYNQAVQVGQKLVVAA